MAFMALSAANVPGWGGMARAADPAPFKVAASILPLHSLLANLVSESELLPPLLPAGASPHSYALRPSDTRRLRNADLIFWVGPALETPLARPLRVLGSDVRIITLADMPDIKGTDPHLWLDPLTADRVATVMADALAAANPADASDYQARAIDLAHRLAALHQRLEARLGAIRTRPFATAHDAYGGLETRYRLTSLGAISASPEHPAGAARLSEVRESMRASHARCLFADPQSGQRTARTVAADTGANVMLLDPLGSDLSPGPDAYFQLMETMTQRMVSCLSVARIEEPAP